MKNIAQKQPKQTGIMTASPANKRLASATNREVKKLIKLMAGV